MTVAVGGVRMAGANGVAMASLAVDLLAAVLEDRVVACDQDRAGR